MRKIKLNRYKGSLIGLAVGDSYGAPYEFQNIFQLKIPKRLIASKTHGLNVGEWTDDTALMLATAHSLIDSQSYRHSHCLQYYSEWLFKGTFSCSDAPGLGAGRSTRLALEQFSRAKNKMNFIYKPIDKTLMGNGCLMKVAPFALYSRDLNFLNSVTKKNCLGTHPNIMCIEATILFAKLVWYALNGYSKEKIFKLLLTKSPSLIKPLILTTNNFSNIVCQTSSGISGKVTDTLEAALYCFKTTTTFETGLYKAVKLGGDTDTVCSVYGQLAGAYYGYNAIPKKYIKKLAYSAEIEYCAMSLYELNGKKNN